MQNSTDFLRLALDLNFYGKRKRDTKLECCEDILAELHLVGTVEPLDLLEWLEENRPQSSKPSAANKPSANTIVEGHEAPPPLPNAIAENSRYIVFGVQNNTSVHSAALAELKRHAERLNATLIALPVYYNKNAFSPSVEGESEYFAPEVMPYLHLEDVELFGGLVVLRPSAAVIPTAKLPINKAQALNMGECSTIVPHTKQQHRTLPSAPAQGTKEAWTTGVITKQNYTRSAAGAEAANDHVYGGILLEMKTDGVHSRNLVFDNGAIYDFAICRPFEAYMVLGDIHSEVKDPDCWNKTLELVTAVKPVGIAVHDILHFSTASHHNRNNGKHLYKTKDCQVIDDLRQVINDLNELARLTPLVYVVESNHNSALDNWLHDVGYNPKRDPRQAKLYYLLSYLVADALDHGQDVTALEVAFNNLAKFKEFPSLAENVVFGAMDTAELWHGVDVSQHGHKGQNGSAGNTNLFSKWGLPMVTGHTHSPAIVGKVLTVGVTAKLDQGYNKGGASSWRQSHGIIHPNGTRQLLPVYGLSF